jgi:hypothetical protein
MSVRAKSKKGISDVDISIMEHLDKYDDLIKLLSLNLTNPLLNKKLIYRAIHIIIPIDPEKALEVINLIKCDLTDQSYIALLIKVYAINGFIIEALNIYNSIPNDERKKRFIIVIFNELAEINKIEAYDLLVTEIYKKFVITEDNISKVYNNDNMHEILQIMSDNEIIIKDNTFFSDRGITIDIIDKSCSICKHDLKKFKLSVEEIQMLKMNLQVKYLDSLPNTDICLREISNLDNFLLGENYNVFVDGNNILFFRDRKVNIDSFRRLKTVYNKLQLKYKPLIFMHQRHKNNIKKLGKHSNEANSIIKELDIYFTPYKMNDDWFFIWAGISNPESFVVTNDLLRDHIFKISEENIISNTLSTWISNNVIKYELVRGEYLMIYPKEYSVKIQLISGIWHIPLSNNKWLCLR